MPLKNASSPVILGRQTKDDLVCSLSGGGKLIPTNEHTDTEGWAP